MSIKEVNNSTNPPLSKDYQLSLLIDVYKHHFDLFIKALALYLGTCSIISGFIFQNEVSFELKLVLSILIQLASILVVLGCYISIKWIEDIESIVKSIEDMLDIQHFPFSGAKRVVILMMMVSIFIFTINIINIWTIIF
jgi:hypothetical protein